LHRPSLKPHKSAAPRSHSVFSIPLPQPSHPPLCVFVDYMSPVLKWGVGVGVTPVFKNMICGFLASCWVTSAYERLVGCLLDWARRILGSLGLLNEWGDADFCPARCWKLVLETFLSFSQCPCWWLCLGLESDATNSKQDPQHELLPFISRLVLNLWISAGVNAGCKGYLGDSSEQGLLRCGGHQGPQGSARLHHRPSTAFGLLWTRAALGSCNALLSALHLVRA
jgi:hypothetical protein